MISKKIPTMTRVCHTCYPKLASGSLAFDSKNDPFYSFLVTFLVSLDLYHRDFFMISMIYNNQSFSVSPNIFFFFSLSPLSSQITVRRGYREKRNKEKDYGDTLKLQSRHHWYHQKELNEINSMITKRSPILLPKASKPLIIFRRQMWHTRVVINDLT
jgi:hypothetical protein